MDLVLLAAGESSRYPAGKPKFLWTMPDGRLMIEHAIHPFVNQCNYIRVVIQQRHENDYHVSAILSKLYGSRLVLTILTHATNGPAISAQAALVNVPDVPVFIKDCDSIFHCILGSGNGICVTDIGLDSSQSYVVTDRNRVLGIAEKQPISSQACAGGYLFASSHQFNSTCAELHSESEIYVSHVIEQMLGTSEFGVVPVSDYIDLGNYEKFLAYADQHKTIFCDIDGVVVENQSFYFSPSYYDKPVAILENCAMLLELQRNGSDLIFTTARPESVREITEHELRAIGFTDFKLIMGLKHGKRVLVNDYAASNPYPSAIAINVPRNGKFDI